jgi:hypothetical protein
MSAQLDMVRRFRDDVALYSDGNGVQRLLKRGSWTVPQVRAVACQLATTSPEEALAILDGVRKFEVGG